MSSDFGAEVASTNYAGPVHASSVVIEGNAVLICGPSGSGKSDLALRLIDRGATLLCDDHTHVSCDGDMLIAKPMPNITGLIEIRGIGLIRFPHCLKAPITMIVRLLDHKEAAPERMPQRLPTQILCGIEIPVLSLHGFEATAPLKIELAMKGYSHQIESMEPL